MHYIVCVWFLQFSYNSWWLTLRENSLVCKSNVVQVPFWEMLYKGKPQNLQYSRAVEVVVASLDAYPNFLSVCKFSLEWNKNHKNILWGFLHNTLKKNRTIKSWQKDTTISSRMMTQWRKTLRNCEKINNSNFCAKIVIRSKRILLSKYEF